MRIKILDKILDKVLLPFLKFDKPKTHRRSADRWLPLTNENYKNGGKLKIPLSEEEKDVLNLLKNKISPKKDIYRSNDYNLGVGDKLLVIFAQKPSILGGVEGVRNGKWYGRTHQKLKNEDKKIAYSKKDLISIKRAIDITANGEYHKMVADFQKKYKDRVLFFDLGFYSLGKKHKLKYESLYTIDDAINGKEYIQDYSKLIEMMNQCEHLLYVGEANDGLDFKLFVDDFDTITVLTDDELFFEESNVEIKKGISLENLENILVDESVKLKEFDTDYANPYGDKFGEIKSVWERRMKNKQGVNPINPDLVVKLRSLYPFLKEIPDTVCESLWGVYAKDTTRGSISDNPSREDFFLDIFLMYSLFDWRNPNEFLIRRPKVSLTKAVLEGNNRNILRFKKIIKKNNIIEE